MCQAQTDVKGAILLEYDSIYYCNSCRINEVRITCPLMNASCFNKTDKDFPFRQMNGYYFCKDITLDVGDGILEDAFVLLNGSFEKWVLVYSYFNGGKNF